MYLTSKNKQMNKLYSTIILAIILSLPFGERFGAAYAQAPNWTWAKSANGTGNDNATSTSTDTAGNVYVTGTYYEASITFGATTLTNAGGHDIFVVKYDAAGNVLWAKGAGGASNDEVRSNTTDVAGNVYITGYYNSISITFGATTLTNANNSTASADVFIVKYDTDGNVVWAKGAINTTNDVGNSATTDAAGNLYVTGSYYSSITFGTTTLTNAGSIDIFIVKYDAMGNVIWAKGAGGVDDEYSNSLSTDSLGNIYVTGYYTSASLTFGASTITNLGGQDIFIAKYDASGNALWAKGAGGAGSDNPNCISTDASGNVYVSGYYDSPSIISGATTLTNAGGVDVFIIKYDASGNVLWAKRAGGTADERAYSIATDAAGNVYIAGFFLSSSLILGTTTITNAGIADIFIIKYDALGNVLWAKGAGGTGVDVCNGISIDVSGNLFVTGYFGNPSITFGATTLSNTGSNDIFIAKLGAITTAIKETTFEDGISIYPNPTKDILNIVCHCGESRTAKQHGAKENTLANNLNLNEIAAFTAITCISIVDVLGNEVATSYISRNTSSPSERLGGASFNIQHLKNGIYFVKVGNEVRKIVKE